MAGSGNFGMSNGTRKRSATTVTKTTVASVVMSTPGARPAGEGVRVNASGGRGCGAPASTTLTHGG